MVSLNKSFLYGICFASFTWMISLYLFWQLNQTEKSQTATYLPSSKERSNDVIDHDIKSKLNKNHLKSFVNSDSIIKRLQPVLKVDKRLSKNEQALSELGMVKTIEERYIKENGYKIHAFNVLVSNQLSLHREIPDTRNKLCKDVNYSKTLPDSSIIICFYNEHNTTLLRSIHSIIDRTPPNLLREIILIDDFSDIENLHDNIQTYIQKLHKVKLFKTKQREGLIRARMEGANKAVGSVLIFLDSHIEVNQGWIEPLLKQIEQNKTTVVMPVIDVINSDTFAYTSSPLVRGGFNWGLHFKWENLPKGTLSKDEDFIKPIKSPTMAGGLFAMDREYFFSLGQYDPGMNIWGGENLEISFRIWMCGGSLELIPCSRVGHVFRQRRPYGDPNGQDTMLHNSLRVAHVWMDDYKMHFLKQRKEANSMDYGDISSRLQLRKDLKCKSFDWYVKNVYPELTLPSDDEARLKMKWAALEQDKYQPWHLRKRNYIRQFQIRLSNTTLCIQSSRDYKTKGSALELRPCIRSKPQIWYETDKTEFVLAQLLCLQAQSSAPHIYKCHEMGGDQEWKHKGEKESPIYNLAVGTCLGVKSNKLGVPVIMTLCTEETFNRWDLLEA